MQDQIIHLDWPHRLRWTEQAFAAGNALLTGLLSSEGGYRPRALAFLDQGLADACPALESQIAAYFRQQCPQLDFAGVELLPGGEVCKNDMSIFQGVLEAIQRARLCRRSYVLAVGGGAVLDVVGFAAATAHRGVRLIRLPSTTLAQGDSGVGVKNGINLLGQKNFLGSFAVPWAVINDTSFLASLSQRDWRCGLAEAVKVALVKDRPFFEVIAALAGRLEARDPEAMLRVLRPCAQLHLQHIAAGDPFETRQGRPLDYGHWAAHRLEQMTDFRLRHGEAVAIGLAIDSRYAHLLGLLPAADLQALESCLLELGLPISDAALNDAPALLQGLDHFQEHLGGQLTIRLLQGIGDSFDAQQIDRQMMARAIGQLSKMAAQAKAASVS